MSLDYLRLLYGEFQKYEVTLIDALPAWGCLITGGNSVRNSRIWLWIFGRIVLAPYSSFGDACQQGIMLWLSTWKKWQICPWLQVVTCSRFPISIARSPLTLWLNFIPDYDKEYMQALKVSPTLIVKQTNTVTLNQTYETTQTHKLYVHNQVLYALKTYIRGHALWHFIKIWHEPIHIIK